MNVFFFGLLWIGFATVSAGKEELRRPGVPSLFTGAESGGATTAYSTGRRAYAMPLSNLLPGNRQQHTIGNSLFNENWVAAPASATARDGLGPLFHARSCSSCHELDGRGKPPAAGETMLSLLLRLSIPGENAQGGPLPDPVYGGQLAPRALPGLNPEADLSITEVPLLMKYMDGSAHELKKPVYQLSGWRYGDPSPALRVSPRVAPAVFGLGLLEAVPEARILRMADPEDADGDGISGRANYVWDQSSGKKRIGRFGWKANTATLRQQTADALANDMGLTSPDSPAENHTPTQADAAACPSGGDDPGGLGPEVSAAMLEQITVYLRTLAPPARRGSVEHPVRNGQQHFHHIGCAACHTPTLSTGSGDGILEELASLKIHPYTDLLLHDMGEELSDNRPDYEATGREWRTPPLWGLGLQKTVNGHERLLHDGRADGMEEAILWHGGEASAAREAWKALPVNEREELLAFLRSL